MKEKTAPTAPDNNAILRVHPGVHERLQTYRKSPEGIAKYGDRFGKPASLYVLVSTILEEWLTHTKGR